MNYETIKSSSNTLKRITGEEMMMRHVQRGHDNVRSNLRAFKSRRKSTKNAHKIRFRTRK